MVFSLSCSVYLKVVLENEEFEAKPDAVVIKSWIDEIQIPSKEASALFSRSELEKLKVDLESIIADYPIYKVLMIYLADYKLRDIHTKADLEYASWQFLAFLKEVLRLAPSQFYRNSRVKYLKVFKFLGGTGKSAKENQLRKDKKQRLIDFLDKMNLYQTYLFYGSIEAMIVYNLAKTKSYVLPLGKLDGFYNVLRERMGGFNRNSPNEIFLASRDKLLKGLRARLFIKYENLPNFLKEKISWSEFFKEYSLYEVFSPFVGSKFFKEKFAEVFSKEDLVKLAFEKEHQGVLVYRKKRFFKTIHQKILRESGRLSFFLKIDPQIFPRNSVENPLTLFLFREALEKFSMEQKNNLLSFYAKNTLREKKCGVFDFSKEFSGCKNLYESLVNKRVLLLTSASSVEEFVKQLKKSNKKVLRLEEERVRTLIAQVLYFSKISSYFVAAGASYYYASYLANFSHMLDFTFATSASLLYLAYFPKFGKKENAKDELTFLENKIYGNKEKQKLIIFKSKYLSLSKEDLKLISLSVDHHSQELFLFNDIDGSFGREFEVNDFFDVDIVESFVSKLSSNIISERIKTFE